MGEKLGKSFVRMEFKHAGKKSEVGGSMKEKREREG